jgi:hypothetical protein
VVSDRLRAIEHVMPVGRRRGDKRQKAEGLSPAVTGYFAGGAGTKVCRRTSLVDSCFIKLAARDAVQSYNFALNHIGPGDKEGSIELPWQQELSG